MLALQQHLVRRPVLTARFGGLRVPVPQLITFFLPLPEPISLPDRMTLTFDEAGSIDIGLTPAG
jgi:hypothetical protein